jgi:hypothetical protein
VSRPLHTRLGEAALLLFGVAASLLLAEALVRLTGLADDKPTGYAPLRTNRRDRGLMNARGYRDVERAIPKPPGTRRVVSLGDSFAWGASIEYDDTYGQRVERALNRRGERWEVVQLAVPGMGTVEQAAQLEDEGFVYGPDVVVLGFVLNDSEDENAAEHRREEDWLADQQARRDRRGALLWRSALYRLVRGRVKATIDDRRRLAAYHSQFAADYPGWIACQQALRRMGELCRQHQVPFVVMIFPLFGNPLDEGYPFTEIHEKVAQAAKEAGATVLDLLPFYRGLRWEILVADGPKDEHPNEIAHRIAAQALLRTLDEVAPPARAW